MVVCDENEYHSRAGCHPGDRGRALLTSRGLLLLDGDAHGAQGCETDTIRRPLRNLIHAVVRRVNLFAFAQQGVGEPIKWLVVIPAFRIVSSSEMLQYLPGCAHVGGVVRDQLIAALAQSRIACKQLVYFLFTLFIGETVFSLGEVLYLRAENMRSHQRITFSWR